MTNERDPDPNALPAALVAIRDTVSTSRHAEMLFDQVVDLPARTIHKGVRFSSDILDDLGARA